MRLFMFTVSLLLISVMSRPALACSCARPPEPVAAMEKARAVFVGQVKDIKTHPNGMSLQVHLDVLNRFKGKLEKQVVVGTGTNSAMCGFRFEAGKQYLVYTFGKKDHHTNICTRTKFLDKNAQAEVLELEAALTQKESKPGG